tara:strand:- start:328 stop:693 length:366 start_codon:yes stop_codon:yes gene_type:complete
VKTNKKVKSERIGDVMGHSIHIWKEELLEHKTLPTQLQETIIKVTDLYNEVIPGALGIFLSDTFDLELGQTQDIDPLVAHDILFELQHASLEMGEDYKDSLEKLLYFFAEAETECFWQLNW